MHRQTLRGHFGRNWQVGLRFRAAHRTYGMASDRGSAWLAYWGTAWTGLGSCAVGSAGGASSVVRTQAALFAEAKKGTLGLFVRRRRISSGVID